MRIVKGILIFHKKLAIHTLGVAIIVGLMGFAMSASNLLVGVGIGYILMAPLFHYFIYDVSSSNEYYFYYNLGLSKRNLWISTVVISLTVGLMVFLLNRII